MSKADDQKKLMKPRHFLYRGRSMHSTFLPGQELYIHPVSTIPTPGDVVVFRKGKTYVVHRVKKVLETGIVTRGDNNPSDDDQLVLPTQVIGIVKKAGQGNSFQAIQGGRWGLFRAQVRWKAMDISNWLRPVIGAPYRWLKRSRLVPRIWHPVITTLEVRSENGLMIKYIDRGKTVATWLPELHQFQCKRVYDLVIFPPNDETRRCP